MLTVDYNLLKIKESEHVLDIGCGEGRHSWQACKESNCLIYALDIEEANLKKAGAMLHLMDQQGESKGRWLTVRGEIQNLPFESATFDKIICSEVMEHIPDEQRGIKEMARVLKDNGILAISVPTYLQETICWKLSRDYHHKPGGHIRIYKTRELISRLRDNSLDVYAVRYKHALHSFYWISRCIFGVDNEKALLPALYHKFLVWDIYHNKKPIRLLEDFLNKFFSKSTVVYARKLQKQSN